MMSLMKRYLPLNNVPLNFIRIVIKMQDHFITIQIFESSYIIHLV